MPTTKPRRSIQECSRLGHEVFDRSVRPNLPADADGKFVAVEIDSGEYAIDEDDYAAVTRLLARIPDAEIFLIRAGYPTSYRFAGVR